MFYFINRNRFAQTSERVWETMKERLQEREDEIMGEKDYVLQRLKEYSKRMRDLMKWHNPLNTNTRTFKNKNSLIFIKSLADDTKKMRKLINRLGKPF